MARHDLRRRAASALGLKRRPAWGKIVGAALVLAALAAAWRFTPLSDFLTADRINSWAHTVRALPWAPLALVAAYVPAVFVMFPRPVLTVLAVIAFGPWLGFAYAMAGVLFAALVTYYAGRLLPSATLERLGGDKAERARRILREHGFAAVFATRIVPVAPFAIEGLVAGAIPVKLWQFMLGTFLGMAPGLLAETVFGGQLAAALDDPGKLNWWAIAAALAGFAVVAWLARRWFKRRGL